MNAFYCSCHAALHPEKYGNRPTAVAGSPETRHGVVVTASYEARSLGVRATMTVAEALRVAPNLILIHPDFSLYREFSHEVFERVRSLTPLVEVFSIDECWADVTGSWRMGSPVELATQLQERIRTELSLPCSIGISNNKFLAKMASDFKKPNGITVLLTEDVKRMLWPLPALDMFGVGVKSAEKLGRLGIHTIGDLAQADEATLRRHFGVRGPELLHLANGLDNAPVREVADAAKSIGHSITLGRDVSGFEELCTVLLNLSDQVGRRVRRHRMVGRTVQITIRFANATRSTITRRRTLRTPTDLTEVIYQTAIQLLQENLRPNTKVRLLGVTVADLAEPQPNSIPSDAFDGDGLQLSLLDQLHLSDEPAHGRAGEKNRNRSEAFEGIPQKTDHRNTTGTRGVPSAAQTERLKKLSSVTDALRDKYGEDIVVRGRMLQDPESGQIRNRKIRGTSLQKDELLSHQKDDNKDE